MVVLNINNTNTLNAGDLACAPPYYFDVGANLRIDIFEHFTSNKDDVILVGGGGLLSCQQFRSRMDRIVSANCKARVLWGAGSHDEIDPQQLQYDRYLRHFKPIGIRDWYRHPKYISWCPCVSCMHPVFNSRATPPRIMHEVVVIEQNTPPRPLNLPYPTMLNTDDVIMGLVEFMESAETVISNSYHAVYWAILLGKKVIILDPFANKVRFFKHQPPIQTRDTLDLKAAKSFPEALAECREANRRFYRRYLECVA